MKEYPDDAASESWFSKIFGFGREEKTPQSSPPPLVQPKPATLSPVSQQPNDQAKNDPQLLYRFGTLYDVNDPVMLKQLKEALKYRRLIEAAAYQYDFLKPSILCGIGSRESHWGLALRPPGPSGRGDFAKRRPRGNRRSLEPPDGPGYGRGLMQIDYDWHEFARVGRWQSPKENILYACTVLNQAMRFFQNKPLNEPDQLRAIIAAYNAGATATWAAIQAGEDIDANTTGQDYSLNVLARSGWFQQHGWS